MASAGVKINGRKKGSQSVFQNTLLFIFAMPLQGVRLRDEIVAFFLAKTKAIIHRTPQKSRHRQKEVQLTPHPLNKRHLNREGAL